MKIEDCKTLPEFFGVGHGGQVWVEGISFKIFFTSISGEMTTVEQDSRALVGCLTGQLKWSRRDPMSAKEIKILREIATWFPQSKILFTTYGDIYLGRGVSAFMPFGDSIGGKKSKAYEVLAPILEKYGEIDLDEYREATAHDNY